MVYNSIQCIFTAETDHKCVARNNREYNDVLNFSDVSGVL